MPAPSLGAGLTGMTARSPAVTRVEFFSMSGYSMLPPPSFILPAWSLFFLPTDLRVAGVFFAGPSPVCRIREAWWPMPDDRRVPSP